MSNDEIYGSFFLENAEVAIGVDKIQEVVNNTEKIIPMPLSPDFLVGIFNLRGTIIPIINLKILLKLKKTEVDSQQKIAIINHEGARIGLLFDSTSEILRVQEGEREQFEFLDEEGHFIAGAIKLNEGNRIVQIINPFALFKIENIPQIISKQKIDKENQREIEIAKRRKCISFSLNQMNFAIDISDISEIIKVPEMMNSAFESDLCLGMVNLRGNTVPIIDFSFLLGGEKTCRETLDERRIMILRFEQALFGFLVDGVDSILTYMVDEVMPIPLLTQERANMFKGCIPGEIILLNQKEILLDEEVKMITHGHNKIYQQIKEEHEKKKKLSVRESFISFKLGHLFGISIKDVKEIIDFTDDLARAPATSEVVKGLLNLRGELVTIIDTRKLYGMEHQDSGTEAKILIFDDNNEKFGLVVDSIESIVMVEEDKKMQLPSLMTGEIRDRFSHDIKEIVSLQEKEVLVILNIPPMISRIRQRASI